MPDQGDDAVIRAVDRSAGASVEGREHRSQCRSASRQRCGPPRRASRWRRTTRQPTTRLRPSWPGFVVDIDPPDRRRSSPAADPHPSLLVTHHIRGQVATGGSPASDAVLGSRQSVPAPPKSQMWMGRRLRSPPHFGSTVRKSHSGRDRDRCTDHALDPSDSAICRALGKRPATGSIRGQAAARSQLGVLTTSVRVIVRRRRILSGPDRSADQLR